VCRESRKLGGVGGAWAVDGNAHILTLLIPLIMVVLRPKETLVLTLVVGRRPRSYIVVAVQTKMHATSNMLVLVLHSFGRHCYW
jgi:hypothetical protein